MHEPQRRPARRIPGARLTVVPNAKHLVQEDAPEAIVGAVLDFWQEQRSRHAR